MDRAKMQLIYATFAERLDICVGARIKSVTVSSRNKRGKDMVGIKDFEMPKACYACPISDEWTGHCTIVGNEQIDKDTGKQINCPLVEIDEVKT